LTYFDILNLISTWLRYVLAAITKLAAIYYFTISALPLRKMF